MLVLSAKLREVAVLSLQASGAIATLGEPIIDPDSLKILGFFLNNSPAAPILDVMSIREYSRLGVVVDSADEFVEENDVIKIRDALSLNFHLLGLRVETKKGTKLGKVLDYTVSTDDFMIQQLIVKRPILKSLSDPELTIPRSEIIKVTDDTITVRDEEKTIRERAENEDFVPNFVNPFRKKEPGYAPADKENS